MARPAAPIPDGVRFGRLVVLRDSGPRDVACRCDCGTEKIVARAGLKSGKTASCSCARTEAMVARSRRHGYAPKGAEEPEYAVWLAMKSRCYRETDPMFPHYGGRGIKVCDRWRDDFGAFITDMGRRPAGRSRRALYSIDRIDNDGDYTLGNCRWATSSEQMRNRRPMPRHRDEAGRFIGESCHG